MRSRSWMAAATALGFLNLAALASAQSLTRYVKYEAGGRIAWGVLEGETIRELQGNVFDGAKPGSRTLELADVRLRLIALQRKCGTRRASFLT